MLLHMGLSIMCLRVSLYVYLSAHFNTDQCPGGSWGAHCHTICHNHMPMSSAQHCLDWTEGCVTCAVPSTVGMTLLLGGRPSSILARQAQLHVSWCSRFPMWHVWEAREKVKEDSPVLDGKGNELGTLVLLSGCCRGQDVGTGDKWGFELFVRFSRDGSAHSA
jgi:hypothetical protein